jgi:hypothetical protein
MMAMSDDEQNQEHANFIADMGGHEDDGRFGAETFSKKVQAHDLDVNLLKKDMDLDSAMTLACEFWIYERKDNLSFFDHIDQDNSKKYAAYMIEMYGGDQAVANEIKVHTTAVLDERIKKLIKISNSAAPVPSVDEKVAKYENAKKLFSTDHNNPIVEDHILFKLYSVLYPFYLDWKSYYEKEQGYDFSDPEHVARYEKNIAMFKEGKVKITKRQLKILISEAITGISKGPLGQVPYREPGAEIRSDLSSSQLQKFDALKDTEPAVRDSIASGLGYEGENFGDYEFEFKTKMAGQDPNESSYQTMYRTLELERSYHNETAQKYYEMSNDEMGDIHDQVEMFISDELLTQNLSPISVLDTIFNKIVKLQSGGARHSLLHMLRGLMQYIAREAVRLNYIVDEQIARKYLGDAGSNPFDDYMKQLYQNHPDMPEENPVDPSRKRRFK